MGERPVIDKRSKRMWIDYDDGHAGGYPHECERCPTCGLHNDNPRALYCSNAWHLTYEDRLPVATKRSIIGKGNL